MAAKPHMNLIFIGHVDHGKSTLAGRLLSELNPDIKREIDKLKGEAESIGKATFEFAWYFDRLKEERERGITIDLSHEKFETGKFYFTLIDAPGHRDFVKNMITGASQADAAVLVVSGAEGVQEQTKEHLYLAYTLGVKQMIVAVNKMDAAKYDQEKFNNIKEELKGLMKPIGINSEKVIFLPVSAYVGDNVTSKSDKLKWFNGPTLTEAFDKLEVPSKPVDKPLMVPVQEVYTITGVGTVPVGRIESGVMKVNDNVTFQPAGKNGEIKSIEMHHEDMQMAEPGDNVGFNVRGVAKQDIKRGDVCGHTTRPPTVATEFTAQIFVLQHPSALSPGYTPVFHMHTAQVACTISAILKKLDPNTGQVVAENPDFIKTGDAAVIKVTPLKPLVIEKYSEIPQLGRFAIRDMGKTIAAGIVLDVVPRTA